MHAPLFTAPVLLVEQPRHLYSHEGHYEVLSESGHPLAYVNEHMSAWSHRQDAHHPHRFTIYGPDGHPLLTLDKPWDRGRPYIHVTGPHGEPYGSIVQDRAFMGSRFRLNDPRGHTIAEIRGDWGGWDFTILDHHGTEIARIGKEHPGLTGGFFTTEDRYALEFAYDLPWPLRRLVLGAAITIDVLLHEREPDFYHSHYADFHRYPEYGYEPRHHWHHPRRGYVVTRRVRRPLAVRTFRPVRRRGDRAFGSRVEAPRRYGTGRSTASRSEAPRRTARADRGATPRSRGGFASRSGSASRRGGGFDSRSESAARRDRTGRASRSESPSSGAAARRERQARSGAGKQGSSGMRAGGSRRDGGGSTSRSAGLFGGSSGSGSSSRSGSGRGGGSSRSSSRSGSSRAGGSSRSSSMRAGGSSRSSSRGSSGRSGGASRSSGGFRSSGGGRSGGSSRRSSGGRSSRRR